jgi:hypothetical protein
MQIKFSNVNYLEIAAYIFIETTAIFQMLTYRSLYTDQIEFDRHQFCKGRTSNLSSRCQFFISKSFPMELQKVLLLNKKK